MSILDKIGEWFRHDCAQDGHRFEPRYDTKPENNLQVELTGRIGVEDARSLFMSSTYVYDICIYCGTVVHRDD